MNFLRKLFMLVSKYALRLFIIQVVCMNLGLAATSHSQNLAEVKVSISMKQATITAIFKEIESKTDFVFAYSKLLESRSEVFNLNYQESSLREILEDLALDAALQFKRINNTISVIPAENKAQSRELVEINVLAVSGTVTDESNTVLPGVNILLKGTSNGTVTDANGKYTLNIPDEHSQNGTLVFSFIGYLTTEEPINGRSTIDMVLKADVQTLTEVVVVGYGEKKKETITGSITTVKSAVITQAPVTNLSNALAGRLPGVIFINRSGEPGYDDSNIRIRGTNTTGDPSALVVIDGIANRNGGLSRLNPQDIESITVLKDASAAIYGAQAANGVILVTTKRGKSGKPQIDFSYNLGFNTPTRLPSVADAATYATMLNEIDEYRGRAPRYTQEDIQKFRDGSAPWTHPNTDWYGEVIKPVSMQDNMNLSLSGGNADGVSYFVSLGKMFEDGFYKNSATKYNQYNFRANLDAKVTSFFKLSVDLSGRQESRNFPTIGAGSIFRMLIRGKPNLPAYWPNGVPGPDIENGINPAVVSTNATGYDKDDNYVFQSNLRGTIDVPWVKGLSVVLNAAFDEAFRPRKLFRTPWYLYTWDYSSYDTEGNPVLVRGQRGLSAPELYEYFGKESGRTSNGYINYTKTIDVHAIDVMVGAERQIIRGNNFRAFRNQFISSAVDQLFAGNETLLREVTGGAYTNARMNYFGRINYAYNAKYLLEMVWRLDGSFRFPEDKRWGFFPGFSAGWVISDEAFMATSSFVDRLKIRGSWGQLGNDRVGDFQYLSLFQFGGDYIFNYTNLTKSVTPSSIVPNPDITWEVANNSNIGVEGTVLNGKISFEVDYFNNIRSQMLLPPTGLVPSTAGFSPPDVNLGKMRNRGIDFLASYAAQAGQVSFQVGVNGGYSKNKVVYRAEEAGLDPWQTQTGKPFNTPLMYEAIGVFKDQAQVDATTAKWPGARPGDIIFRDVNNDNVIDGKDRVRLEHNTIPRFQGGVSLDAQYKGFDVSVLLQGATGARSYIRTQSGEFGNYLTDFSDGRWTTENPSDSKPRTFNREDEYWISQGNTYWYRNTNYLRLKTLQVGYSLPTALISKVSLKSARIYVNGLNLFTIDKFDVFDPETDNQDGTVYPQKRVYNVGVNLSF